MHLGSQITQCKEDRGQKKENTLVIFHSPNRWLNCIRRNMGFFVWIEKLFFI
ncbi:hypothetical protein A33Q_0140 [Indibacter alkaliphilus LW1]|uniref:Uncharacterized protein n=1 Tax=Indibacter alkaliphilus (strain CCUG 57479 / KCTC 22604 / LW1) TaxID=1189612 RepID=S2ED05_INDAL|nr:hypothetical protein A33Q_0140 [Indibacter alkaliphilus LW1]